MVRAKHQPSPIIATTMPPKAGPTVLATLNIVAFKAMAWRKSSRPTISIVKDCRTGTSTAVTMPPNKDKAISHSMVIKSAKVKTARTPVCAMIRICVTVNTCLRFMRSAMAPPKGEMKKIGA